MQLKKGHFKLRFSGKIFESARVIADNNSIVVNLVEFNDLAELHRKVIYGRPAFCAVVPHEREIRFYPIADQDYEIAVRSINVLEE